jgi:hypothetical protein
MPSTVRPSSSGFPHLSKPRPRELVPRFFSGFQTVYGGFPDRRDSRITGKIKGSTVFGRRQTDNKPRKP